MEAHRSFPFRLVIFLALICHVKVEAKPFEGVNLGPFWQWRNAYECLQKITDACAIKDVLTLDGEVNVTQSEVGDYCKPNGCRDQTMIVLNCIREAKRDFWFANRLTVPNLTEIITNGCTNNQNISTPNITVSGATRASGNWLMLSVSSLAAIALVIHSM